MTFLLQRIFVGIGGTVNFQSVGLNLAGLTFALRFHEPTGDVDARAGGYGLELVVGKAVHVEYHL